MPRLHYQSLTDTTSEQIDRLCYQLSDIGLMKNSIKLIHIESLARVKEESERRISGRRRHRAPEDGWAVKDQGLGNSQVDPSGRWLWSGFHLAGMALHHVDVENSELQGEESQGHRRPPEDEFNVADDLRWSHSLVLHCRKLNSSFVMLCCWWWSWRWWWCSWYWWSWQTSCTCTLEKRGRGDSPISSRLRMIAIQIDLITLLNLIVSQEVLAWYFVFVVFVMLLKLTTTIVYLEQRELSAAWRASGETLTSFLFLLIFMRISVPP